MSIDESSNTLSFKIILVIFYLEGIGVKSKHLTAATKEAIGITFSKKWRHGDKEKGRWRYAT